MTTPPLPSAPCVRVRLDFKDLTSNESGCRFYLSYSGSAPTGANCDTLATDISASFGSRLAGEMSQNFALSEVDVLDIASNSGLSGQWNGTINGGQSGQPLPLQVATNIEFGLARRYRGGKPRIYLPPSDVNNAQDTAHWTTDYVAAMNTNIGEFFSDIAALTVGAMGTLAHVNISYYQGFTNHTNTSGRERAVPTYRTTALVEPITGYSTKQLFGSQRRRRTATTY